MTRINIVAWHNGGGLSRDIHILLNVLGDHHCVVHVNGELPHLSRLHPLRDTHRAENADPERVQRKRVGQRPYDANLFLEEILPSYVPHARLQALIPNPEWFRAESIPALAVIDWVLCKTRSALMTFDALGLTTRYIGFTSSDRLRPNPAAPAATRMLHLAGRSWQKGTEALVELWRRRPDWPVLTLVQSPIRSDGTHATPIEVDNIRHILKRLDDLTVRHYQNEHRIHLCPSVAEGFGHTLVEAMSCAALTLTTDAPPMNELITSTRGVLVGYHRTSVQNKATLYEVDLDELEQKIDGIINMGPDAQQRLGAQARRWYQHHDQQFRHRLITVLQEMGAMPST